MANDEGNEGIENLRKAHNELKENFASLQEQHRKLLANTTFKEAGLNPKHADLFLTVNGDEPITAEAVANFVEEYDLASPAEGESKPEGTPPAENQPEGKPVEETPSAEALQQMGGAGQGATGATPPTSPGSKMSLSDFQKLMADNPSEAVEAYRSGRVEHAEGNPFV